MPSQGDTHAGIVRRGVGGVMMNGASWVAAAYPAAVLALILVIPGFAIAWLAKVRGVLLMTLAPALGAGVWAIATVVWGLLGLRWALAAGIVATAALGAGVWAIVRKTRPDPLPRATASPGLGAVLAWTVIPAAVLASLLQIHRVTTSIGSADAVAQSYDTVFHLNAVQFIITGGNASPFAMTMADPEASATFYPTLWHSLVALAVPMSGGSIPIATNALVLVVMCLVWPLSMLALARVIFGPDPMRLGLTALLVFAFPAFPNRFVSFGVLYPNLLAHALLPAALALVLMVVRPSVPHGRRAWLVPAGLGALAMFGLGCAHPNGVFGLLALATIPLAWRLVRWTRREAARRGANQGRRIASAWAVASSGPVIVMLVEQMVPGLAQMLEKIPWATQLGGTEAIAGVLTLSTSNDAMVGQPLPSGMPVAPLAALVLVGVVIACRTPLLRWLPASYGVVAVLWVVAVSWDHPMRAVLTGLWYGDQIRIAGLLPIAGVLLAVLGATGVVRLLRGAGAPWRLRLTAVLTLAAVGTAAMGWLPATRESFERVAWMHSTWPGQAQPDLLSAREAAFLDQVAREVPAGEMVVTNTWDGGSLLWALEGVAVAFPSIQMAMDAPRAQLADSLIQAGSDPRVCDAVRELDAYWVVHLGDPLWGLAQPDYPAFRASGTYGLVEAGVAQTVLRDGDMELLRVTACTRP